MNILILGCTSSVGKELMGKLSLEHHIYSAGRTGCDFYFDLSRDDNDYHINVQVDAIINVAASISSSTFQDILVTENINALGTIRALHLAYSLKTQHFIQISSIYSFLNLNSPYYNIYALSKKHSEELVEFISNKYNIAYTILRFPQLYSSYNDFKKSQPFFYNVLSNVLEGKKVSIYGKHDPLRNYMHISDVNEIIYRVLSKKTFGTYSCIHPKNTTFGEIAKIAFKIIGKNEEIEFLTDKENIADNVFDYDSTLYRLINYFPQVTIENGIKMYLKNQEK